MRTIWALCSRTEKAAYKDVVKKELPTEERRPLATPAPGTPALMCAPDGFFSIFSWTSCRIFRDFLMEIQDFS